MPGRPRVEVSKIRIRELFRRLALHEIEDIDRFRALVQGAANQRRRTAHRRADRLPPEGQELIADELSELDVVAQLAAELSVVALHRVVEITAHRMLAHEFGKKAAGQANTITGVKKLLTDRKGIDLAKVPHYKAIDKLRLMNNGIKHQDMHGYSVYDLEATYTRIRVKVPAYIFRLAQRMRLRYR